MTAIDELRLDVGNAEKLQVLAEASLPLELKTSDLKRDMLRDVYYDTTDAELHQRGVAVRVRHTMNDRRHLTVRVGATLVGGAFRGGDEFTADVTDEDPANVLSGASDPARRLKAIIDALVAAGVVPDDTPEWIGHREPRLVKGDTVVVEQETTRFLSAQALPIGDQKTPIEGILGRAERPDGGWGHHAPPSIYGWLAPDKINAVVCDHHSHNGTAYTDDHLPSDHDYWEGADIIKARLWSDGRVEFYVDDD